MKRQLWLGVVSALALSVGVGCAAWNKDRSSQVATYPTAEAFETNGTIAQIKGENLMIARQGQPTLTLKVAPRTQIVLNGSAQMVVGVMPADFMLPIEDGENRKTDVYVPLAMGAPNLQGWGNRSFITVARLQPGASLERATILPMGMSGGGVGVWAWTDCTDASRVITPTRIITRACSRKY